MWPDQEFEKKVDLHRAFVEKFVAPSVDEIEETKMVPCELVDALGSHGYLGGLVPASVGGLGFGRLDFGFAIASLSAESSSIRNLLTVHNMVAASIHRWGSDAVKDRWLKAVATGKAIGALALTEFGSGSDFDMIETTVSRRSGGSKCRARRTGFPADRLQVSSSSLQSSKESMWRFWCPGRQTISRSNPSRARW